MCQNNFLFSVDLEDVRDGVVDGGQYKDRVVENTYLFLNWLEKNNFKCTFFVVGKIAERYPDLIKEIKFKCHEIACHSYEHVPIDKLGKENFRQDIEKNINALLKAGADRIAGFRAPVFSLTERSLWAYDVLKEFNILYSSSVLPAKNPLYGWEDFGESVKRMDNGIVEIPMTIGRLGPLRIPIAGGVYFRIVPKIVILKSIKKCFEKNNPVMSYFHPYDADVMQEKFMHGGINNNRFFNFLMYYNRKNLFTRLDSILDLNPTIITYRNFTENFINGI
jgi:polysaccharide deacetylase family protein (PEP-CTERM system associated)